MGRNDVVNILRCGLRFVRVFDDTEDVTLTRKTPNISRDNSKQRGNSPILGRGLHGTKKDIQSRFAVNKIDSTSCERILGNLTNGSLSDVSSTRESQFNTK